MMCTAADCSHVVFEELIIMQSFLLHCGKVTHDSDREPVHIENSLFHDCYIS